MPRKSRKLSEPKTFVGTHQKIETSASDDFGQTVQSSEEKNSNRPEPVQCFKEKSVFTLPGWEDFVVGNRPEERIFIFEDEKTKISVEYYDPNYKVYVTKIEDSCRNIQCVGVTKDETIALSIAEDSIREIVAANQTEAVESQKGSDRGYQTWDDFAENQEDFAEALPHGEDETDSFREAQEKSIEDFNQNLFIKRGNGSVEELRSGFEEIGKQISLTEQNMKRINELEAQVEKSYVIKNKHLQEKLDDAENKIQFLEETIVENSNDFYKINSTVVRTESEIQYLHEKFDLFRKSLNQVYWAVFLFFIFVFAFTYPLFTYFLNNAVEAKVDSSGKYSVNITP